MLPHGVPSPSPGEITELSVTHYCPAKTRLRDCPYSEDTGSEGCVHTSEGGVWFEAHWELEITAGTVEPEEFETCRQTAVDQHSCRYEEVDGCEYNLGCQIGCQTLGTRILCCWSIVSDTHFVRRGRSRGELPSETGVKTSVRHEEPGFLLFVPSV